MPGNSFKLMKLRLLLWLCEEGWDLSEIDDDKEQKWKESLFLLISRCIELVFTFDCLIVIIKIDEIS